MVQIEEERPNKVDAADGTPNGISAHRDLVHGIRLEVLAMLIVPISASWPQICTAKRLQFQGCLSSLTSDCEACKPKLRCCPKTPLRAMIRSIHEGAWDLARASAETNAFVALRRAKQKIEILFAYMKMIMGLSRMRLRGPNGAKDEFTQAAVAQNLRKMAKLLPIQRERSARQFFRRSSVHCNPSFFKGIGGNRMFVADARYPGREMRS